MKLINTPSAVPLTNAQFKTYDRIKSMLEDERPLMPSDLDAIAMLVIQIDMLKAALKSIKVDGSIVYSTTQYGTVPKANPANEIAAKANTAIKGYLDALLMTPKSKLAIMDLSNDKVDTSDPLTAALLNRKAP